MSLLLLRCPVLSLIQELLYQRVYSPVACLFLALCVVLRVLNADTPPTRGSFVCLLLFPLSSFGDSFVFSVERDEGTGKGIVTGGCSANRRRWLDFTPCVHLLCEDTSRRHRCVPSCTSGEHTFVQISIVLSPSVSVLISLTVSLQSRGSAHFRGCLLYDSRSMIQGLL